VLIGILAVTIASIVMGFTPFGGVMSMPPSLAPTFLQLDIKGALDIGLVSVIFAFLFVDLFDNSGTLIGVAKRAGLMSKDGHMPKMGRALIADSTAAMAGSLLGTSTTTSYIESAAGVSAGGRTGLTAVVVAILFLLALFFSPLAASVPAFATAPALLFVAVLMTSGLAEIDWGRHHRCCTGRGHRPGHAIHLFHRQRHRLRFHLLDRDQVAVRPRP